ncbi:MAG TPA: hypothetical protein VEG38_12920 [Acidimicrobiia bacterium]|nr:hypothetical protein [Acidimicrobiia bacterium]
MGYVTSPHDRIRSKPLLSAGAVAAVAWMLWILLLPSHGWSKHISNVGLTLMPLMAAWQCARQAAGVGGRLQRGWRLMGGSCLAWGIGMVVWTAYESIGGRDVPFPSLADVGYLATVPLAVAAVLIFPSAPQRLAAQVRTVVDGLVIGAALLIVSWILALGPVVRGGGTGLLADVIGMAYPLGDVIMATIVLFAMARSRLGSPLGRSTLLLLCGGLLAIAVADSGFSYLALQDAYASGMRIDVGWFVGYLLVFLAARQSPRHAAAWMEPPLTSQSATIVPYAAVGLAAVTMIAAVVFDRVDPFVCWAGLFLVAALVARRVLMGMDRAALQRSVEAWVPLRQRGLEDWVPVPPRPRTLVGDGRRRSL